MKNFKDYIIDKDANYQTQILENRFIRIVLGNIDALIVLYIVNLIKNNQIVINDPYVDKSCVDWVSTSTDCYSAEGIVVRPNQASKLAQLIKWISEHWDEFAILMNLISKNNLKKISNRLSKSIIKAV